MDEDQSVTSLPTFDPSWEEAYSLGDGTKYPWDVVVTFILRHAPKAVVRGQTHILEIGCGTGANLWFAAREGFRVAGIDASPSAIRAAQSRFLAEGLEGDFRVCDFANLPFPAEEFDLAIDRIATTHCGLTHARKAIAEVHRILRPEGKLFWNVLSAEHAGRLTGSELGDGLVTGAKLGSTAGRGQACYYTRSDVMAMFKDDWIIESISHVGIQDHMSTPVTIHAEWRVVARKI